MNKVVRKFATWLQHMSDPSSMLFPIDPKVGFFNGSIFQEQSDGVSRWFTVADPLGLSGFALKYEIRRSEDESGTWDLISKKKKIFHDQSRPSLVGDGYLEISRIQGPSQQIADSYKDAKRYYTRSQSVAGSKPSSALKWVSLMVAAFFVFTYFVSRPVESQPASAGKQVPAQYSQQSAPVPQAPQQMQQPQPLAQQPSSSIATAEAASPVVPNEAHLSDDEKRVVSSIKNSFNIGSGSKAFYIFSDPNCPHCRRLESSLSHLPDGYHAIMVPVAYQAGSRDLAAKVMCSKDHAAAWKDASFSGVAAAAVCAKGLEMIDENNRIFESLRLTSTPSFVSPGGVLFSGFMSPDQLANLVKN